MVSFTNGMEAYVSMGLPYARLLNDHLKYGSNDLGIASRIFHTAGLDHRRDRAAVLGAIMPR